MSSRWLAHQWHSNDGCPREASPFLHRMRDSVTTLRRTRTVAVRQVQTVRIFTDSTRARRVRCRVSLTDGENRTTKVPMYAAQAMSAFPNGFRRANGICEEWGERRFRRIRFQPRAWDPRISAEGMVRWHSPDGGDALCRHIERPRAVRRPGSIALCLAIGDCAKQPTLKRAVAQGMRAEYRRSLCALKCCE